MNYYDHINIDLSKMSRFPIRPASIARHYKQKSCLQCKGKLRRDKIYYLNAGACADSLKSKIVDQDAFWNVHVHTSDSNCHGNAAVSVIELTDRDQFEFLFCSIKCMRAFLLSIVSELALREKKALKKPKK
jgi:hypothetical protein